MYRIAQSDQNLSSQDFACEPPGTGANQVVVKIGHLMISVVSRDVFVMMEDSQPYARLPAPGAHGTIHEVTFETSKKTRLQSKCAKNKEHRDSL